MPADQVQWTMSFSDGNGNRYRVTSAGANSEARLMYSPVTAEESSSGTYSGGVPADTVISIENNSEIWRRFRALKANTARHTKNRSMGSGSFHTQTSDGESNFLISMGSELSDFTSFMTSLRTTE